MYRFDKDQIAVISNDLGPSIEQHRQDDTLRGRPLTAQQQFIIALKFFAHGTSYRSLAEQFGVGLGSISRIISN